jgi:hypothetical protein
LNRRTRHSVNSLAIFFASLLAIAASAQRSFAGAKMGSRTYSFKVTNDAGKEARGYYIAVPGILPSQVDIAKSGGKVLKNVRVNPPPGGGNGVTIFFENKDAGIANGADETITLRLTGLGAADKKFGRAGFRDKGDATGIPIGDYEFNPAHKVVGDPIFSLLNNDEEMQNYEIQDLQFLVNSPELADPTEALDFGSSFGFVLASPAMFSMSASDVESMPFSLPPVNDGNWLYARFHLFNLGQPMGAFVLGQEYVPEPSTIAFCTAAAAFMVLA